MVLLSNGDILNLKLSSSENNLSYLQWESSCRYGNAGVATFVVSLFVIYLLYAVYLRTNAESLYIADQYQPLLRKSVVINKDRTRPQTEIYDPRLIALLRVSAYMGMYASPYTKAPIVCKATIGLMLVITPVVKIVYPFCSTTYDSIVEAFNIGSLFASSALTITPLIYLWYHCFFNWFYNRFLYCRKRDSDQPVAPYFWDNEISREIFMNDDFRLEGREAVLNSSKKWTVLTVYAIYFNVLIVLFSVAYEVWLGYKKRLSPIDCLWLGYLSITANGLEAINVNTLLILGLHARMYRKITKVYFRVTKSTLKVKGIISAFTIYREMVDQAFYKLSRLSHVVSVMALGLIFLLIVVVVCELVSPFRQVKNNELYTFLLGILVTAIWGYFVGHSIGGVFDSILLPFLHLRKHFLHQQQGDQLEDRKGIFNWVYIEDMLQVAEMFGFENTQVEYVRQACEFFDKHKGEFKQSLRRVRTTTSSQNVKDIFQQMNRSCSSGEIRTAKVGRRLFKGDSNASLASSRIFKGDSIASTASSQSDWQRNSGSSAVRYLIESILNADNKDEVSEQVVPAKVQTLLIKVNSTVERFWANALQTLLSEVPEDLKDMNNLREAAELWDNIRESKEFQTQLKNELLGQEEVLKEQILAAVLKRIPNAEFVKVLGIYSEKQDKNTPLLNLLMSVLKENAPELQCQISGIVRRALVKTTTQSYRNE